MEKSELFSIIITNYNQEKFIFEAIKSVINQTYKNIEIIITDDKSIVFPNKEIINHFKKINFSNYTIIENDVNLGTVKTVHNAIFKCKGKYVLFFAADDALYDNNIIEKYVKLFKNKDVSIISSKCLFYDEHLIKELNSFPSENDIIKINNISSKEQHKLIMKGSIVAPGATAFKTSIIKNEKYLTNTKYIEDWPLFLKLTKNNNKIYTINTFGLKHRAGGISENKQINNNIKLQCLKDYDIIYTKNIFPYLYKCKFTDVKKIFASYIYHNSQYDIKYSKMNFKSFILKIIIKITKKRNIILLILLIFLLILLFVIL